MNVNPRIATTIVVAGATLLAASPALMDHLGQWESSGKPILVVYADKLANGLPTVCKGLTNHVTTTPIIVGQRWTIEQCEREERAAVIRVQYQLAPCFRRPPNQTVWDMTTSLAWNVGAGKACGSGAMQAFNRGEWQLGCRRIARGDDGRLIWSYAGGKFVQGLANRRLDESSKCGASL